MNQKTCDNCMYFGGWENGRGQCCALPEPIRPAQFFGGPGLTPYIIIPSGQFFIENCPAFREGAITGHKEYLLLKVVQGKLKSKVQVKIYHNNETGEWLWSVTDASDPEFWLNSFDTEQEAHDFCNKHGLQVLP